MKALDALIFSKGLQSTEFLHIQKLDNFLLPLSFGF